MNPDVSSSKAPGQLQGDNSGGDEYFSSLWLSFSLSFWIFFVWNWIGILGFLLGLLGLLKFGFVEVFFFFFWDFVAAQNVWRGGGVWLNFLVDGSIAITLYVCVI